MRRERQVVAADAVVAGAVRAFVMELHRPGLGRDELEPLQQARREARMAPHRGPLGTVEATALAQEGGIDSDLAEVVQPSRPA